MQFVALRMPLKEAKRLVIEMSQLGVCNLLEMKVIQIFQKVRASKMSYIAEMQRED